MTSVNKLNEITAAISALWIYQNKSLTQARKEAFSRFTLQQVSDYQAMEREESRKEMASSDSRETF